MTFSSVRGEIGPEESSSRRGDLVHLGPSIGGLKGSRVKRTRFTIIGAKQ